VDNKFLACDSGLYFKPNNDSYGYANNCAFVHCGVSAIFAHTIPDSYGFNLENCFIVQAPIICLEANKLSVSNCQLNTYFEISDGEKNMIVCNTMSKQAATADGVTDIYDVPQDTVITMNRGTGNDADYNWD
jgi:hypothetical protein